MTRCASERIETPSGRGEASGKSRLAAFVADDFAFDVDDENEDDGRGERGGVTRTGCGERGTGTEAPNCGLLGGSCGGGGVVVGASVDALEYRFMPCDADDDDDDEGTPRPNVLRPPLEPLVPKPEATLGL